MIKKPYVKISLKDWAILCEALGAKPDSTIEYIIEKVRRLIKMAYDEY